MVGAKEDSRHLTSVTPFTCMVEAMQTFPRSMGLFTGAITMKSDSMMMKTGFLFIWVDGISKDRTVEC